MPVLFKIKRRPCKMAFFLCMRILLSPDKMDCAPLVPLTVYWQGENLRRGLSCKRGRRKYDICVGHKDEVQKQNREEENEKLNILI